MPGVAAAFPGILLEEKAALPSKLLKPPPAIWIPDRDRLLRFHPGSGKELPRGEELGRLPRESSERRGLRGGARGRGLTSFARKAQPGGSERGAARAGRSGLPKLAPVRAPKASVRSAGLGVLSPGAGDVPGPVAQGPWQQPELAGPLLPFRVPHKGAVCQPPPGREAIAFCADGARRRIAFCRGGGSAHLLSAEGCNYGSLCLPALLGGWHKGC